MESWTSSPRLPVAVVSYLNARPLTVALRDEPGLELLPLPPSGVAAALAARRAVVGLVPAVELLRQPGLRRVSDAGIVALGAVDSVILALRTAPTQVRTLSLDPQSRTSQILARIVLADRFGVVPVVYERQIQSAVLAEGEDAALVIGDEALRVRKQGVPHVDLASEWFSLTGRPFVFAVWAGPELLVAARPELAATLERARELGLARIDEIAADGAGPEGLDAEAVRVYLRRRIRYRLGAAELDGLRRFLDRARPFVLGGSAPEGTDACSTSVSSARIPMQ